MKKLISRLLVLVAMPLAIIWALNTLFGTQIEFKWETWASVLVMMVVLAIFLYPLKKD